MKIACIGWGSLIWNPGELKTDKNWRTNGPLLPIEFLRQSKDGRLTLVLHTTAKDVPTLYSLMLCSTVNDAIKSLMKREDCTTPKPIGVLTKSDKRPSNPINEKIYDWLMDTDLDTVIWTALGPKFKEVSGAYPSPEEALQYLANLTGDMRSAAEVYIRKAPGCVTTLYRKIFEEKLGWTAI